MRDNPGGRPKKYASAAEKQAAFRARYPTISVRTESHVKNTIKRLMEATDLSEADVVNMLIKFALLNRNWFAMGAFGRRLPHASDPNWKPRDEFDERNEE